MLLLALPGLVLAELRIASWNIQNFGWGQNKSVPALVRVVSKFDIVAIQELMNAEALEALKKTLEQETGDRWETLYSEPLGQNRYREKYAFIWRADTVEYVDGAVLYIADHDRFAREPYSARFRASGSDLTFVLATVHVVYGRRVGDRTPEVEALRGYWDWLAEVYPEDAARRLLLGDFNLRPTHTAWSALTEVAQPLIKDGATTLSSNDRQYANLYDNIFVARAHALPITGAGILRFPELLSDASGRYWSHEKARRHVSDHAPVYALLDGASVHPMRRGPVALPDEARSYVPSGGLAR